MVDVNPESLVITTRRGLGEPVTVKKALTAAPDLTEYALGSGSEVAGVDGLHVVPPGGSTAFRVTVSVRTVYTGSGWADGEIDGSTVVDFTATRDSLDAVRIDGNTLDRTEQIATDGQEVTGLCELLIKREDDGGEFTGITLYVRDARSVDGASAHTATITATIERVSETLGS